MKNNQELEREQQITEIPKLKIRVQGTIAIQNNTAHT